MDSTYVHFTDSQLNRILSTIGQKPHDWLSPELVALIAALIGATAATLPQFILFYLQKKKEKIKLKSELISEERRIAILLYEYYKEFVLVSVNANVWFMAQQLKEYENNGEMKKFYYQKAQEYDEKVLITKSKTNVTVAEYFKTIAMFTIVFRESIVIRDTLTKVKEFPRFIFSNFNDFTDTAEALLAEADREKEKHYTECLDFYALLDNIHNEMKLN